MSRPEVPDKLRELVHQPDWYMQFERYLQLRKFGTGVLGVMSGRPSDAITQSKERLLREFTLLLSENAIALGSQDQNVIDWDEDRQPIDRIVIHHSLRTPLPLPALNALHLLRLYVPRYQNKNDPVRFSDGKPQPITSSHYDEDGNPVFYGYHHIIRPDGSHERLLPDLATAWHSGNWEVNCRSVGICLEGDFSDQAPSDNMLNSLHTLIRESYSTVPVTADTIVGHSEVAASQTACPGPAFLHGWKLSLLEKLNGLTP